MLARVFLVFCHVPTSQKNHTCPRNRLPSPFDCAQCDAYNCEVPERLQKILSARGIASRRKAEEYITQGLVTVNGKVAMLGQKADPETDKIEVSGKVMETRQKMLYYVMYKPRGVITENVSRVCSDEKTVLDLIPASLCGKIYPVGRLDKDSEGLLLFTNDGVLAYRLTHPKFDHEKEYEVTVTHEIKNGQIRKLEHGMTISGIKTKPARILRINKSSFRIAITEGKNRQIRRMCQKVGAPVATLKRVRIMTLQDFSLKPGMLRPLTIKEKTELLAAVRI